MNCKKYRILIEKYLDGVIDEAELAELKEHSQKCAVCRKEFQQCKNLQNVVHEILSGATSPEQARYTILSKLATQPGLAASSTSKNALGTIIRSRITKLAAAAAVIMAAVLITYRGDGTFDLTPAAFAEMIEAMKKTRWLHITYEVPGGSPRGRWFCYEDKTMLTEWTNGQVQSLDFLNHRQVLYHPDQDRVIISYFDDCLFSEYESPEARVRQWMEYFQARGVQVTHKAGLRKGVGVDIYSATVYKMTGQGKQYLSSKSKLVVERSTHLPIANETKDWDAEGNLVYDWGETYNYPESGPKDIYDLGVPKSAERLDPAGLEVLETYRSCRDGAPARYVAILRYGTAGTRSKSCLIDGVDIFYSDHILQRLDGCVFAPTAQQKFLAECGDSFESLMKWWTRKARNGIKITDEFTYLYDEKYSYKQTKCSTEKVPITDRAHAAKFQLGRQSVNRDILAELGWPFDLLRGAWRRTATSIVADDYSKQNKLVRIEVAYDGYIDDEHKVCNLPQKCIYYLNPERDYICQRREIHRQLDAPWKTDPDWLKDVDRAKITLRDRFSTKEVLEYGRTESGHWYPKRILRSWGGYDDYGTPGEGKEMLTIYLNDSPVFPEGIFDPATLLKGNR